MFLSGLDNVNYTKPDQQHAKGHKYYDNYNFFIKKMIILIFTQVVENEDILTAMDLTSKDIDLDAPRVSTKKSRI